MEGILVVAIRWRRGPTTPLAGAQSLVRRRGRIALAGLVLLRTGGRNNRRRPPGRRCVRKGCPDVGKFKLRHLLFILEHRTASYGG